MLTNRSRRSDDYYEDRRGISLSTRNIGTDYDLELGGDGRESSIKQDVDSPRERYSDHGDDRDYDDEDGMSNSTEGNDDVGYDYRYKANFQYLRMGLRKTSETGACWLKNAQDKP
ncbi:hypothetical protein Btru_031805 [Bulinus truncatus]|nr:hypothetical protein Btru_031805 [Bulinus truncatus]